MKESRKCDSLKVAFDKKGVLLEDLIKSNLSLYNQLDKERKLQETLQIKLKVTNTNLLKLSSKKGKGLLWGVGGVLVGAITYSLIK